MASTVTYRDPRAWAGGVIADAEARKKRIILAIQDAVMQGEAIAQEEVDATEPHKPVDRGTYRRAFKSAKLPNGATLYNSAPYAGVMEEGRRPGTWPNIGALTEWVKRKGLIGEKLRVKKSEKALMQSIDDAVARSLAFLIAAKMKARGMAGRFVMKRTIARLTNIVDNAVDAAIEAK